MTITEATHALARRSRSATAVEPARPGALKPVLFVEAMRHVEPTWVEAVAVVQSVCAQLSAGQAAPTLQVLTLTPSGAVTFPAPSAGDDLAAVRSLGQLLRATVQGGVCPMQVWDAIERATCQPVSFGSVRAFGAALTGLTAVEQSTQDLCEYYAAAASVGGAPAREALSVFERAGVAGRSVAVAVLVVAGGVGTGISTGALLVARTLVDPPAMVRVEPVSTAAR